MKIKTQNFSSAGNLLKLPNTRYIWVVWQGLLWRQKKHSWCTKFVVSCRWNHLQMQAPLHKKWTPPLLLWTCCGLASICSFQYRLEATFYRCTADLLLFVSVIVARSASSSLPTSMPFAAVSFANAILQLSYTSWWGIFSCAKAWFTFCGVDNATLRANLRSWFEEVVILCVLFSPFSN